MKLTSLFTTAAFTASAVTSLNLPSQDQPSQPETLKIKVHKLDKREVEHPTGSPEAIHEAIVAKCDSLKGTATEPDWCRTFHSLNDLCKVGPIETNNGLVYELSLRKGNVCPIKGDLPTFRDKKGKILETLSENPEQRVREKCLEAEQKEDPMCREFLKSGRGEFYLKVFSEEHPEGYDFEGSKMIFGRPAGVAKRGVVDEEVKEVRD